MCGCPEPIEPDVLAFARDLEGSPAYQSGTEQRRERHVAAYLAERERKPRIGNCRCREPAVSRIPSEERPVTEVLAVLGAIGTDAAGVSEPWYPHALTHCEPVNSLPEDVDATDDFMAGNDR
jgi:hypothetical protein